MRAVGTLGEGVTCRGDTGRALAEAGLHPATGGDGSLACSGDMLLEALAACASEQQLDTLLRLTERYRVVGRTLAASPTLAFSR